MRHQSRAHRIELDVAMAREEIGVVRYHARLETPFPKATGTLILCVGSSGEMFIQAAHLPTHIAQPLTPQLDDAFRNFALVLTADALLPAINERGLGDQTTPTLDDFLR